MVSSFTEMVKLSFHQQRIIHNNTIEFLLLLIIIILRMAKAQYIKEIIKELVYNFGIDRKYLGISDDLFEESLCPKIFTEIDG